MINYTKQLSKLRYINSQLQEKVEIVRKSLNVKYKVNL